MPKTIDNDLSATDFTFGFDTAINIVMEAVDRLRTTAESHRRIMVIETMGRHAGWIACLSGIAVAADYILVPEVPVNLDHMCAVLRRRREEGKMYGIVVVSEGAQLPDTGLVTSDADIDEFGHVKLGGIGEVIAERAGAPPAHRDAGSHARPSAARRPARAPTIAFWPRGSASKRRSW